MNQYKRRMDLDERKKIFIFDSKDIWMKRALMSRGWE